MAMIMTMMIQPVFLGSHHLTSDQGQRREQEVVHTSFGRLANQLRVSMQVGEVIAADVCLGCSCIKLGNVTLFQFRLLLGIVDNVVAKCANPMFSRAYHLFPHCVTRL